MAREKAVAGHKCLGAVLGVETRCECGWRSCTWYGKGARSNAYGEWRMHVDSHQREAGQ